MTGILTNYYLFEKTDNKTKGRMLCTASTGGYAPFERMRATKVQRETEKRVAVNVGDLAVYCGQLPDNFNEKIHKEAVLSLTDKTGHNISSIITPDRNKGNGYGDYERSALLFIFNDRFNIAGNRVQRNSAIEVFVAQGRIGDRENLYRLLIEGKLDGEVKELRQSAKIEGSA